MCKLAADADVEVDPDGLQENIDGIIANKLQLDNGGYLPLPSACEGSADISFVPAITVIDIYNYLLNFSQYDHTTLRNYCVGALKENGTSYMHTRCKQQPNFARLSNYS